MKIIILGAGQVGGTLAEHLADEQNDITVVDERAATLKRLQERLDIRTVLGNGAHPTTLMNAGADDADMLIAVTDSDEINMLACSVAFTLFRTPTKISRVRSTDYLSEHAALFASGAIPVDVIIGPEQLVTVDLGHYLPTSVPCDASFHHNRHDVNLVLSTKGFHDGIVFSIEY